MSLSTEAISLPSQAKPPTWKGSWRAEGHAPLREWSEYLTMPPVSPPWIGGQFFYPHYLVEIMSDEHRAFAEDIALSIRGGSHAVWINHPSGWEVRAVR